jgi:hypothetical protein
MRLHARLGLMGAELFVLPVLVQAMPGGPDAVECGDGAEGRNEGVLTSFTTELLMISNAAVADPKQTTASSAIRRIQPGVHEGWMVLPRDHFALMAAMPAGVKKFWQSKPRASHQWCMTVLG